MQKKIEMCDHCGNPATAGRGPDGQDPPRCIGCAAVATVHIPAAPERRGMAPESVRRGRAWPAARDLSPDGTLWLHQARVLEALERGENVVVSTSTASGKSLPFQLWALHGMASDPDFTGIIFYPTKALANDQARRWQAACRSIGMDPGAIGEINGDVRTNERDAVIRRARLVVMTPDVCHAWMTAHASTEPVRTFLRGLGIVIIDEAHTYEFVFGSNSAYLFRRLAAAAVHAGNRRPPQLIAATATIKEPLEHLENLTGQRFTLVDESENGSPRHVRTIHHLPLPARGNRERALASLITSIIDNDPASQVIAFEDSRQGIERTVQMVGRPASVMPYRSGYLAGDRRKIEDALRDNAIRGIISTSALELGIDMRDLTHGINLDLPPQKKNFHQRLGRVGRSSPGTFIILAPAERFSGYGDSLEGYYQDSVEPSKLYLDNEYITFQQAVCLRNELEAAGLDSFSPPACCRWEEGFEDALKNAHGTTPPHLANLLQRAGWDRPQRAYGLRSMGEEDMELFIGSRKGDRIGQIEVSRAMREAYPGGIYRHRGKSYVSEGWAREKETRKPFVVLSPAGRQPARTRPIIRRLVTVGPANESVVGHRRRSGLRGTAAGLRTTVTESVEGYETDDRTGTVYYKETSKKDPRKSRKQREFTTTALHLQVAEPWATGETGDPWRDRLGIARALREQLAYRRSIAAADLAVQVDNVVVETPRGNHLSRNSIIVYDNLHGGLGLAYDLYEDLGWYAARLNRGEVWDGRGMSPESAEMFLQWAQDIMSTPVGQSLEEPPPAGEGDWWRTVRPGSLVEIYSETQGGMVQGEVTGPFWNAGIEYEVDAGPEMIVAAEENMTQVQPRFDWQLWQPRTGQTRELELAREERQ